MNFLKKGMDSFTLKMLALVFMTFDHIHYFLTGIYDIPFWFSLLGRVAAPVFLFTTANGFRYTHNRVKYMLRLYLFSVGMEFANMTANQYFMSLTGAMVINNIFATLFYVAYFLFFLEMLRSGIKNRRGGKIALSCVCLVLPFLLTFGMLSFSGLLVANPGLLGVFRILMIVLPTPLLVEGSVAWIGLGIAFYYLMDKKGWLTVFYLLVCALFFAKALPAGFTFTNLFVQNQQWFMILALPLFLLYNGKKGRSMKYFFYLYYPAHVYGLLALSHLLYR